MAINYDPSADPEGNFELVTRKHSNYRTNTGIYVPLDLQALVFTGKNRRQRRREAKQFRQWKKRQQ